MLERLAATVLSKLFLAASDHFFKAFFRVEALGYRVPFGAVLASAGDSLVEILFVPPMRITAFVFFL